MSAKRTTNNRSKIGMVILVWLFLLLICGIVYLALETDQSGDEARKTIDAIEREYGAD